MKVLFLVPYPLKKGPNVRFRLECYLPYLVKEGIQYKVSSFASDRLYSILFEKGYTIEKFIQTLVGYAVRLFDFLRAFRYDCIFIYRETTPFGPVILPWIWKLIRKRVLFDFDDAIYLRSSSEVNRFVAFFKCPSKTRTLIRISSEIIAGNHHLYGYAERYHTRVTLIPTPIDTNFFFPGPTQFKQIGADKICIGWVGSPTTLPHFYLLKDILQKLSQTHPIQVVVLGSRNVRIPNVGVISMDWDLEIELEILRSFDIGVMPLPDDEWSHGKCGFKLLQYMAVAVPTVSSPVGVNAEIIQEGKNGFLASSDEEWFEKLSLLIEDKALREWIGIAGRKTVEQYYSVERWKTEFIKAFKNASPHK